MRVRIPMNAYGLISKHEIGNEYKNEWAVGPCRTSSLRPKVRWPIHPVVAFPLAIIKYNSVEFNSKLVILEFNCTRMTWL